VELLALRDEVLDIAVTPTAAPALGPRRRREAATAFGLPLQDPALLEAPAAAAATRCGWTLRTAATATSPASSRDSTRPQSRRRGCAPPGAGRHAADQPRRRRHQPRQVELGQPLHAFDLDALRGEVVVRRARAGERLTTLDGQDRALGEADLLITDDSGPIALAGVMGGGPTEVTSATTAILLESAHFAPLSIARTARRHRLPSEASRRYERGVDPALAPAAAERAVRMLVDLGGATAGPVTDVDSTTRPPVLSLPVDAPGRLAGREYRPEVVRQRLEDVGCTVTGDDPLEVVPPTWRPDLTGKAELIEEVLRLEGYDTIPVVLPSAPPGRGLTPEQRLRRTASRALAAQGLVEVVTPPFVGAPVLEALGEGGECPEVLNPLSAEETLLRPSLLPGLLSVVARNTGRGLGDVAVYETGLVFLGAGGSAPAPGIEDRPTAEELAALDAALPAQPRHAGLAVSGSGWDVAVSAVVELGRALGLSLWLRAATSSPTTRAAAPSCSSTTGAWAWPASCTRGRSRHWDCPPAPAPARWTSTSSSARPLRRGRCRPRTSAHSRRPASTSRWSSTGACRRPRSKPRCAPARGTCWRRSGSSTCSPVRRSARASGRWPTPCGCGHRTGP
jgi:phenylalanyl-tRNA synthetase beta chain